MRDGETMDVREVRIHAYGGPDAMTVEDHVLPAPGPGEVLLRQHAVGINFIDVYHRKGVFPIPHLPGSLGVEGAGEVVAIGAGVTRFHPGDRVAYAGPPVGSYVSGRLMREAALVRLPDAIDFKSAAALMLQGMTAHMLFTRVRPVKAGDTLLVHAAAGGLGLLLTQWASFPRRTGHRHGGVRGQGRAGSGSRLRGGHPLQAAGLRGRGPAPDRWRGGGHCL